MALIIAFTLASVILAAVALALASSMVIRSRRREELECPEEQEQTPRRRGNRLFPASIGIAVVITSLSAYATWGAYQAQLKQERSQSLSAYRVMGTLATNLSASLGSPYIAEGGVPLVENWSAVNVPFTIGVASISGDSYPSSIISPFTNCGESTSAAFFVPATVEPTTSESLGVGKLYFSFDPQRVYGGPLHLRSGSEKATLRGLAGVQDGSDPTAKIRFEIFHNGVNVFEKVLQTGDAEGFMFPIGLGENTITFTTTMISSQNADCRLEGAAVWANPSIDVRDNN